MKQKSYQDLLDDMFGSMFDPSKQGQLGSQQSGGGLTIGSSGGTVLTPAQLSQMLQGLGSLSSTGLTQKEKEELENLKQQYSAELKAAKLAIFKKLASELRQYVINSFIWKDALKEMGETTVEKSNRLSELELKESLYGPYSGKAVHHTQGFPWTLTDTLGNVIQLPEGITIEDLKQAHLEACLEEEVLDGE